MRYLLPLLILTAACGGSPTGPTPAPVPSSYVVSGTITATNGGQPLAGVTLEASGASATTDASGRYTLTLSQASARYTLHGDGIVTRTGMLRSGNADLEAFAGDFDLGYFRQLARDGYDQPNALQPIAHWTAAPQVYLRTVDESGAPMQAATLELVSRTVSEMIPAWTGGTYAAASVEQGTSTREGQAGWLTVKWTNVADGFCGRSTLGVSGGYVDLHYGSPTCTCGGYQTRPRTVKHEIGHAMGLRHTGTAGDLMAALSAQCDAAPSAREIEYARYLYRRPAGNTDADNDPN